MLRSTRVEHERPRTLRIRASQAGDHCTLVVAGGIASRSHHHAKGRARIELERFELQPSARGLGTQFHEVGSQAREYGLRLRVAKATIELHDARITVRIDHQARVEKTTVGHAFCRERRDGGGNDAIDHPLLDLRRDHRRRRVGTHAAGVRPKIALIATFVVLGGGKGQEAFAIGDNDEARLLSRHEFLDHHTVTGAAECITPKHVADGRESCFLGVCNDHPLARSQTVGLHDDRGALLAHVGFCFRKLREGAMGRRWNSMALEERLAERFRSLELGRGSARSEAEPPRRLEPVHDARNQRSLRSDYGQRNVFTLRESEQSIDVLGTDGDVLDALGHGSTSVAWRDIHPRNARGAGCAPGKRMLAATAANDENLHECLSGLISAGSAGHR